MRAELEDGKVWITSDYMERHLVKSVPGMRFDRQRSQWWLPCTWAGCLTLRHVLGQSLELGPVLQAWAWKQVEEVTILSSLSTVMDNNAPLDERLFGYQNAGASFLATGGKALLADEPGLGKTAQAIAAVTMLGEDAFPVLVVVPNSTKRGWQMEIENWTEGSATHVIQGTATQRRKQLAAVADDKFSWTIINWESVRLHTRVAGYGSIRLAACEKCGGMAAPREDEDYKAAVSEAKCEKHLRELNTLGFKTVIADESHRLKDAKAKQTRAVWQVMHDATYRFALTGTPIADNIGDLWSILHGIDSLAFPVRSKFLDVFASTRLNFFGGFEILGLKPEAKDLFYRILSQYMRRTPKSLALPQLPPKLDPSYRYVQMKTEQARQYKSMRENLITLIDNDPVVAANPLTQLTRLRQFASATGTVGDDGHLRLSEPSCKIDDLMEYISDHPRQPLVVAAESKQLINLAAQRLRKAEVPIGLVTGDQTTDERANYVQMFQDGKLQVILMTLGAGGEGLTLTAADTIYFLERSDSMLKNTQAEGRVHRIGSEQHQAVHTIICLTEDTIEDNRELRLALKDDRLQEVVQDRERLRRVLSGNTE